VTEVFAYTFRSDLMLEEIFSRLNEVGPWKWTERDNDRWADYMSAVPVREPHRSAVKILIDPDSPDLYAVNVLFKSDHPDAQAQFDAMRITLFERLLPAIGARDLTRTDTYE
jgi:hypothetical protein